MEVNISDKAEFEKLVKVKVPYEDLVPRFNKSYGEYKKSIQLEGFRKGKVPLDLVKKVFGPKIEKEVAENSVSEYLEKAVEENDIKFHDIVKMESLDYDRENGLSFEVRIRVEPEIELKQYDNLKVEVENYKITEDDVNESLANLQEQHATLNTIDGEAKEGHYIIADLQKTDSSGHPLIGEKYDNRFLQIGGENMDDTISEQLIGVKAGDVRKVTIPVENESEEEQQDEHFSINVKEVKEKKLPELDDEFARDVSEQSNLEELKDSIEENLKRRIKTANQQTLMNNLIDEAVKANPIDLPDFMIERYLDALIENMKSQNQNNVDGDEIRKRYRADAIRNLKWIMIKDKIAEIEDLKVEDEEVEQKIEEMINNASQDKAKIRRDYKSRESRNRLKYDMLEEKVLALLKKNAKITEQDVNYQDYKSKQESVIS